MSPLSKSKLIAFRQCTKRLWLEVHRRELLTDSDATKAKYNAGNIVGELARKLYDTNGQGYLIETKPVEFADCFNKTVEVMAKAIPIFEAGFKTDEALAFADILLPLKKRGQQEWKMIEVKSSTSVKQYHRDDVAIQSYVARSAGANIVQASLLHIDTSWTYPGKNDYQGLLKEVDLTEDAFGREEEVEGWIQEAHQVVKKKKEPMVTTGDHCNSPFECGFSAYCQSQEPQVDYPVQWLPRIQTTSLKAHLEKQKVLSMEDVPDTLLNEKQLRVKHHTLQNQVYFDAQGAADALAPHKLPAYFLDFETIQFAVPIWKGTKPYQQIPFQYSVHRLNRRGALEHQAFLDLSGKDPSKAFAEKLIDDCGSRGPIFVYNAGFEKTRISELAQRFPRLSSNLLAINDRIVDLWPIAKEHFYHPSQKGSWSIKAVLPAIAPDLSYENLAGVQNGGDAMAAFLKAISVDTEPAHKAQIEEQLLAYCGLDTLAMVRLWAFFSGNEKFAK